MGTTVDIRVLILLKLSEYWSLSHNLDIIIYHEGALNLLGKYGLITDRVYR